MKFDCNYAVSSEWINVCFAVLSSTEYETSSLLKFHQNFIKILLPGYITCTIVPKNTYQSICETYALIADQNYDYESQNKFLLTNIFTNLIIRTGL